MRRTAHICIGLAAVALAVAGAGLASARNEQPEVTPADQAALSAGNRAFAVEMYGRLSQGSEGNLFFSPYSISQALGMTYAGARGETARQMAAALHFDLPAERLHPAFNALDLELARRAQGQPEHETGDRFRLNVANSIWVQRDFALLPPFVATLTDHYGVEVGQVDYVNATEDARVTINSWVAERTEDRIRDLLGPDVLTPMTRLVLTNAIYFNASWASPFREEATEPDDFELLDGSEVEVPMMRQVAYFHYAEGEDYEAISLPYLGNALSMVVILPEDGELAAIEGRLATGLGGMLAELRWTHVDLTLPRFRIESSFSLSETLKAQGMPIAFDEAVADLRAMAELPPTDNLYISEVVHKAFVAVDETGTEAAAATAVVITLTSSAAPEPESPVEFKADRPFLVVIRDEPTGTILFMGRVMNPAG